MLTFVTKTIYKKNALTARKILKSQVERWEGKYSAIQKKIVSLTL